MSSIERASPSIDSARGLTHAMEPATFRISLASPLRALRTLQSRPGQWHHPSALAAASP